MNGSRPELQSWPHHSWANVAQFEKSRVEDDGRILNTSCPTAFISTCAPESGNEGTSPLTDVLSASTRIKVTPTALQETVPSGLCHVSNFLKFPLYLISSRNGLKNKNKTKRTQNSQLNFAASLSLLNYPRVASQAFPGHRLSDLNPNKPPSASLDFTGGRNTDSFSLIHAHGKAEVHGFFFFFPPEKGVSTQYCVNLLVD